MTPTPATPERKARRLQASHFSDSCPESLLLLVARCRSHRSWLAVSAASLATARGIASSSGFGTAWLTPSGAICGRAVSLGPGAHRFSRNRHRLQPSLPRSALAEMSYAMGELLAVPALGAIAAWLVVPLPDSP
eukprot:Skav220834  [mRNA]  locus=scaffold1888:136385:142189:+ [translate_table: standard]